MIKPFKKKIKRNYYKVFDRNAEVIDELIKMSNSMSEKLDEIITKTNELEKALKGSKEAKDNGIRYKNKRNEL